MLNYFVDILQVCRGLMIASIVVGFAAIFVTVLGLKCVTIGGRNVAVKARVAMAGGLMFGIAGGLNSEWIMKTEEQGKM